ncbi:MAG: ferrous iron transport protein A [Ruminococcaceae bacterium]|nr:ferrous iron transport protein A [Oscillospiraceae bacterium]
MNTLDKLPIGMSAYVKAIKSSNQTRRLLDLGLVKGTIVTALQKSPCGDPIAYDIRGAVIALRKEDARQIIISGGLPNE